MCDRNAFRSVPFAWMSRPSSVIVPDWIGSSRLIVRISVDLPEPDGPHTTTTSPRPTDSDTSTSAWYAPYHLLTFSNRIIGGDLAEGGARGGGGALVRAPAH